MDEFCKKMKLFETDNVPASDIDEILMVTMAQCKEFEQIKVRPDEMEFLNKMKQILKKTDGAVSCDSKLTIKESGSYATQE